MSEFQASVDKELFLQIEEKDAEIERLKEELVLFRYQVQFWKRSFGNLDRSIQRAREATKDENEKET